MPEKSSWADDTVALGAPEGDPAEIVEEPAEDPPRRGASIGDDRDWGEDTVVLRMSDPPNAEVPRGRVGRREPLRWRVPVAVLATGVAILIVLALGAVLGGGGESSEAPHPGSAESAQPPRSDGGAVRVERRELRRGEREARRRRVAERRRARENRRVRKATKAEKREAPEPTPAPEYVPEPEPEYVPEYSPERVPEPAPAPEPDPTAPSPTPPAVEFGM